MKIGYYSYYPIPWKGMARKMWEHHHHIFRIINQEIENLEIHPMIRPKNNSKIKKVESGDTSVLVDGFQKIKFVFHEEFDNYEDYDALFLEPGRVFMMDEVFAHPDMEYINKHRMNIYNKVNNAMKRGIPILWYDGDADLMSSDPNNYALNLWTDLNMNNYSKCVVAAPYEDCKGLINNFKFVPYNIDFRELPKDIKNATDRSILSIYFGSNYHRNSFIPHFNYVSNYGEVVIYGSSWNSKKFNDNVKLNKAIWLPEDGFVTYYDRALFGLYGDNDMTGDYKHYTLRVAEYLKAGIYIIPDNKDYLREKFKGTPSISEINESIIEDLKNNYVEKVLSQREILRKTFDSKLYVDVYYSALKGVNLIS